jgi:hypothetical protein
MRKLLSAIAVCVALAGCAVSGPPQVSELSLPGEGSAATAGAGDAAAQTAFYTQQTSTEGHRYTMGG